MKVYIEDVKSGSFTEVAGFGICKNKCRRHGEHIYIKFVLAVSEMIIGSGEFSTKNMTEEQARSMVSSLSKMVKDDMVVVIRTDDKDYFDDSDQEEE